MGIGGCYSCIKYLMFAFNFLFWLLGCALVGVGIWLYVDSNFQTYSDGHQNFGWLSTGAVALMVVGGIIMVVGFLGCCGAIRESQCMLTIFFILLFLIFISLLGAGIWAIIKKNDMKKVVSETLQECVDKYMTNTGCKNLMDDVQEQLNCCGASDGLVDYTLKGILSQTCDPLDTLTPCDDALLQFLESNLVIIAGITIGIGIVMLVGMFLSMYLCCKIRRSYRVGKYRYQ